MPQLYLDVVVVVVDEREPGTDDLLCEDRHSWRCYRCHCRLGTELRVRLLTTTITASTRLGHLTSPPSLHQAVTTVS